MSQDADQPDDDDMMTEAEFDRLWNEAGRAVTTGPDGWRCAHMTIMCQNIVGRPTPPCGCTMTIVWPNSQTATSTR